MQWNEEDIRQFILMLAKYDGNMIDIIAVQRGWTPLVVLETMQVTYGMHSYIITRLQDDE